MWNAGNHITKCRESYAISCLWCAAFGWHFGENCIVWTLDIPHSIFTNQLEISSRYWQESRVPVVVRLSMGHTVYWKNNRIRNIFKEQLRILSSIYNMGMYTLDLLCDTPLGYQVCRMYWSCLGMDWVWLRKSCKLHWILGGLYRNTTFLLSSLIIVYTCHTVLAGLVIGSPVFKGHWKLCTYSPNDLLGARRPGKSPGRMLAHSQGMERSVGGFVRLTLDHRTITSNGSWCICMKSKMSGNIYFQWICIPLWPYYCDPQHPI